MVVHTWTRSKSPTRSKRAWNEIGALNLRRDPIMLMVRSPAEIAANFVICPKVGCMVTDFNLITPRMGLSRCTRETRSESLSGVVEEHVRDIVLI